MDYCRSNGSAIYTRCNQPPKHLGNTGTIRNKPFGYCECLPLKNKRYFHQFFDFGNTVFSINLTRYAIIHFCCKSPLRHQQCFLRCFVMAVLDPQGNDLPCMALVREDGGHADSGALCTSRSAPGPGSCSAAPRPHRPEKRTLRNGASAFQGTHLRLPQR